MCCMFFNLGDGIGNGDGLRCNLKDFDESQSDFISKW